MASHHQLDPHSKTSAPQQPASAFQNFGSVVVLRHNFVKVDSELIDLVQLNLDLSICSNIHQLSTVADSKNPICLIAYACGTENCGLKAYKLAKASGLHIPAVFIAANNDFQLAIDAMRCGAVDFILRPLVEESLVGSVLEALAQSRSMLKQNDSFFDLRRRAETLSTREIEIVNLVLSGLLNKEIANRLNLAEITVKVHRGSAMHKLGARTSADLARIVHSAGLWQSMDTLSNKGANKHMG